MVDFLSIVKYVNPVPSGGRDVNCNMLMKHA